MPVERRRPRGDLRQAFVDAGPYDVVVDFLWGRPTEVLLQALVPDSFGFGKPTRIVQVGESAGASLAVAAASLRTSGVEIYGATKGFDRTTIAESYEQVVAWVEHGELTIAKEVVGLQDIGAAWQRTDLRGKRLVVVP